MYVYRILYIAIIAVSYSRYLVHFRSELNLKMYIDLYLVVSVEIKMSGFFPVYKNIKNWSNLN